MTHEPECPNADGDCCPWIGQRTALGVCNCQCDCDRLRAAYARGVDAARQAVASLDACPECSIDASVAAIDSLRDRP